MNVQDSMSNEHGLIRQFLDNLALAAEQLEDGKRPPAAFFEKAVTFARTFADKYHHFKEEQVMFVLLAQKKNGEIDAQLEAARYEHERGRYLVSGMSSSLEAYAEDRLGPSNKLLESVAAYIALLRSHIHREDHVFLPMAYEALSEEELQMVQHQFDESREKNGGDMFERSHKLVLDMGQMLLGEHGARH